MTTILEWTPTRFAIGDFDTAKRYIRSGSGGYALATGETIKFQFNGTIGTSVYNTVTWHFAITGYMDLSYTQLDTSVFRDPGTPTPTVTGVKI